MFVAEDLFWLEDDNWSDYFQHFYLQKSLSILHDNHWKLRTKIDHRLNRFFFDLLKVFFFLIKTLRIINFFPVNTMTNYLLWNLNCLKKNVFVPSHEHAIHLESFLTKIVYVIKAIDLDLDLYGFFLKKKSLGIRDFIPWMLLF